MTPSLQISLSFALTFGVPSALGVWELLQLRRREPPEWRCEPQPFHPQDPPPRTRKLQPVRELEDA